jgi:hypothetical protein
MAIYKVQAPDGSIMQIEGPDGATDAQIAQAAAAGYKQKPDKSFARSALETARDLGAGALRGAGSIGATLLAPKDIISDALDGKGLSLQSNRQRRADMDAALGSMGANTDSLAYGGGKLVGEIAGTAGAGGALGNLLARSTSIATKAPALLDAIRTSGMSVNGLKGGTGVATRAAGGAVTGGTSAALISPEDAAVGAIIGGVAGPAVAGAAKLGGGAANLYRSAFAAPEKKLAQKIATVADIAPDKLRALLSQQGPQLIQNYQKTVPQILQNPAISQLQRTLKTAGNDALGGAERLQQQQFMETLNRVAPVQTTVQDAAERAGGAIQDFALPAEKLAAERTAKLFDSIPVNEAQIMLPLQKMQEAQSKFLPPGSFGKGVGEVEQAMRQATNIGTESLSPLTNKVVPFNQIQALRSSISDAITKAQKDGQNQAVAALTQMKNQIDNKVAAVASGELLPGEIFTPRAIDMWGQALASHASKKQQFNTGPQIGMFRQGGDGQQALQGAEIPGKFYSGRNSQVPDLLSFKRLLGNSDNAPALTRDLQSYATTQAADTTNAAGNLTSKYGDWLRSRSGANRELFGPEQNAALKAIDDAVTTGANAENLGRISGPDTAQKLASLQSNGLLDNRVVDVLANRLWGIGSLTGPMLQSLRNTAGKKQSDIFARLLANPQELEAALKTSPQLSGELAKALMQAQIGIGRVAPAIYAD